LLSGASFVAASAEIGSHPDLEGRPRGFADAAFRAQGLIRTARGELMMKPEDAGFVRLLVLIAPRRNLLPTEQRQAS